MVWWLVFVLERHVLNVMVQVRVHEGLAQCLVADSVAE